MRDDERCGRKSIHQNWLAKRLGLLCWGFKGVQQEILSEEVSTLQIGSVAFPPGQYTSPQLQSLSQTIWLRRASRQFLSLPIVQILLPETFGYSLSSEAVVMRQLRRWKRLWRRSLTYLNFMCVLSIKVPIRKNQETYLMILVYIYIYIYILFAIHFFFLRMSIITVLPMKIKSLLRPSVYLAC